MAQGNFMTMDEVNDKLDKGLEDIFNNERFQEMLNVMSKFRNYSLNNSIMIMIQRPDATMVKGFRQWQELGRHVNKGEKGMDILAPKRKTKEFEKTDPVTNEPVLKSDGTPEKESKQVITGYVGVKVFDVQQTDGKEIPSVRDFVNRDLQDDNSMSDLYHNFMEHIKQEGVYSVQEDETENGVGGFYRRDTNEIVVSNTENATDTEKFRTLVHEYGHAKLHHMESDWKDLSRQHKEAQAESVAYVVSNYYGLETDDVSLGYIATWAKDMDLARQALNEIQDVSNDIVDVLDDLQQDKIHEFYQESNKTYEDVKDDIEKKFDIDFDSINQEKPDMQFEILQKDRGNVLSARLEFSEKSDKFHMRLNNNRIIPLDDFDKESGNYTITNHELNAGDITPAIHNYKDVNDYNASLLFKEQKFAVTDENFNNVSNKYDTMDKAEKHLERMGISQALHHQAFLNGHGDKSDSTIQERQESLNLTINYRVGQFLSNEQKDFQPTGDGGKTIGWTLMKRPDIQNINDLDKYVEDTKHIPSNKGLRNAMEDANIQENTQSKEPKEKDSMELE